MLGPSHYLRAPALSCEAMLSMRKVELELISDADMYLFFQNAMRDGVSKICKRCSKANNKYLKSYYPTQESKHIIFLEANKQIIHMAMTSLNFFQKTDLNR